MQRGVDKTPAKRKDAKESTAVAILTVIDEPIVIGVVRLGAVALALELDCGDALGPAVVVVVKRDLAERTDGSRKELLKFVIQSGHEVH